MSVINFLLLLCELGELGVLLLLFSRKVAKLAKKNSPIEFRVFSLLLTHRTFLCFLRYLLFKNRVSYAPFSDAKDDPTRMTEYNPSMSAKTTQKRVAAVATVVGLRHLGMTNSDTSGDGIGRSSP